MSEGTNLNPIGSSQNANFINFRSQEQNEIYEHEFSQVNMPNEAGEESKETNYQPSLKTEVAFLYANRKVRNYEARSNREPVTPLPFWSGLASGLKTVFFGLGAMVCGLGAALTFPLVIGGVKLIDWGNENVNLAKGIAMGSLSIGATKEMKTKGRRAQIAGTILAAPFLGMKKCLKEME